MNLTEVPASQDLTRQGKRADSPMSPPFKTDLCMQLKSDSTSPRPMLSPCPARGWIVCAASPTRTVRAPGPSPM